jgi:hypothetical protein
MIVKIVKELILSMLLMLVIIRICIIQIQIQIQIQMDIKIKIKINGIINYINNSWYLIRIKISIIRWKDKKSIYNYKIIKILWKRLIQHKKC